MNRLMQSRASAARNVVVTALLLLGLVVTPTATAQSWLAGASPGSVKQHEYDRDIVELGFEVQFGTSLVGQGAQAA